MSRVKYSQTATSVNMLLESCDDLLPGFFSRGFHYFRVDLTISLDMNLLKSSKRKLKSQRTSSQKSLDSDVFPLSKNNSSEGNDSSGDVTYSLLFVGRMRNRVK